MNNERFSKNNWFILILFGLVGQIAWSVENMYFNVFVYNTIAPDLDAITLMVQLSGVMATIATLVAGTLSDKFGHRRRFISIGYAIWGVTVALFGFISPELVDALFNTVAPQAVSVALVAVIVGDCVMTLFGSTANDAAFNAWVTDNTRPSYRGTVEGVVAILPLVAMLIVAGGFGILVSIFGYSTVFLVLGIVISLCGIAGLFVIKDSEGLKSGGGFRDIFYGFRPSVVRENPTLYLAFLAILVYSIGTQIFMPYMIIYMQSSLEFSVLEYSVVFGGAIAIGAVANVFLGRLSDRMDKTLLLYIAAAVMSAGLIAMYFAKGMSHGVNLALFGIFGCVMLTGYIFVSALTGSIVRDNTPASDTGKLQGVRMIFSVLIPMIVGPMIGNGLNKWLGEPIVNPGETAMTTEYVPVAEIFLVGGLVTLLMFAIIPCLKHFAKKDEKKSIEK